MQSDKTTKKKRALHTFKTWYPSVPPPGISTDWPLPIICWLFKSSFLAGEYGCEWRRDSSDKNCTDRSLDRLQSWMFTWICSALHTQPNTRQAVQNRHRTRQLSFTGDVMDYTCTANPFHFTLLVHHMLSNWTDMWPSVTFVSIYIRPAGQSKEL